MNLKVEITKHHPRITGAGVWNVDFIHLTFACLSISLSVHRTQELNTAAYFKNILYILLSTSKYSRWSHVSCYVLPTLFISISRSFSVHWLQDQNNIWWGIRINYVIERKRVWAHLNKKVLFCAKCPGNIGNFCIPRNLLSIYFGNSIRGVPLGVVKWLLCWYRFISSETGNGGTFFR